MRQADKKSLRQWLDSIGLGLHADSFEDNDIGFDALPHLTDADLKELGLSLGHRRILQAAIGQWPKTGGPEAPAPLAGRGERRQITVLFCDLVGSTEMSTRLDPEDLRTIIHAYYSSCCRIVEASGGFVARIVGDGILAYFGYPRAKEDAAESAIRAALQIVEAAARERLEHAMPIDVRIGLATGVSVISDMIGIGFSELHAVMGQTPNLAARIQSLVAPGNVGVSDHTRRLAGGFFVYADQGKHAVKGFSEPVQVWRVLSESRAGARFDAQHVAHMACVGRHAEVAAVQGAWLRVREGRCHFVTLVGEAGIGKSRLLRTACEQLRPEPGLTVLMQCSPNHTATPLHPLVDWLWRDIGVSPSGTAEDRTRLERWLGREATPVDLGLLAEFLSLPVGDGQAHPPLPPDRKRQLTREIVLRHVERHCDAAPSLLVIEDVHWIDGATEEFLIILAERLQSRPLLVLVTSRPGHMPRWADAGRVDEVALAPLPQAESRQLIQMVCKGRMLPPALVDEVLDRTDGVPLFIEELTATILESGLLREQAGTLVVESPLPALDIPLTLRDSLMARLDRLSDIKSIARVASALGREFSFTLLAQVCAVPEQQLVTALDRLVDAQLLFKRGVPPHADYVFKHSLIQQAAYDSQLRSDRTTLHARIVRAIETHQPQMAHRDPGLMAHHCELAGLTDGEVDYLYAAGMASTRIVAIPEALSYFARADTVMSKQEPSPRNVTRHIHILLRMMEVGRFTIMPGRLMELSDRARSLSHAEGVTSDAAMTAAILFQDGRARLYSGKYGEARAIFDEIRQLGLAQGSSTIERKPASAFGMNLCCQGLFDETLEFINEGNIDYYKETGNFIDYLAGLGWIAYACCQTGMVDDGLRLGHRAVLEAEQVQSPIYLSGAYIWRSHALMAVRQFNDAVADARRCVALSQEQAVPYLSWHGLVFLALCLCRQGDYAAATASLAQARELLEQLQDGRWSLLDYLPAIEAEIACHSGNPARALRCCDEAITLASATGGHFAEAMAWRVKALVAVGSGDQLRDAQACFDRATDLYERGGAAAECCFSALLWAHALAKAGHATHALRWVRQAQELAKRHGFVLERCEHGAAAVLRQDPPATR